MTFLTFPGLDSDFEGRPYTKRGAKVVAARGRGGKVSTKPTPPTPYDHQEGPDFTLNALESFLEKSSADDSEHLKGKQFPYLGTMPLTVDVNPIYRPHVSNPSVWILDGFYLSQIKFDSDMPCVIYGKLYISIVGKDVTLPEIEPVAGFDLFEDDPNRNRSEFIPTSRNKQISQHAIALGTRVPSFTMNKTIPESIADILNQSEFFRTYGDTWVIRDTKVLVNRSMSRTVGQPRTTNVTIHSDELQSRALSSRNQLWVPIKNMDSAAEVDAMVKEAIAKVYEVLSYQIEIFRSDRNSKFPIICSNSDDNTPFGDLIAEWKESIFDKTPLPIELDESVFSGLPERKCIHPNFIDDYDDQISRFQGEPDDEAATEDCLLEEPGQFPGDSVIDPKSPVEVLRGLISEAGSAVDLIEKILNDAGPSKEQADEIAHLKNDLLSKQNRIDELSSELNITTGELFRIKAQVINLSRDVESDAEVINGLKADLKSLQDDLDHSESERESAQELLEDAIQEREEADERAKQASDNFKQIATMFQTLSATGGGAASDKLREDLDAARSSLNVAKDTIRDQESLLSMLEIDAADQAAALSELENIVSFYRMKSPDLSVIEQMTNMDELDLIKLPSDIVTNVEMLAYAKTLFGYLQFREGIERDAAKLDKNKLADSWARTAFRYLTFFNEWTRVRNEESSSISMQAFHNSEKCIYLVGIHNVAVETPGGKTTNTEKYLKPRTFDFNGKKEIHLSHIKFGAKPPAPRLHYLDCFEKDGTMHIGYFGEHLWSPGTARI